MHGVGARAGGSVGRQYVTAYRTTTLDEASALPPTPPPSPYPPTVRACLVPCHLLLRSEWLQGFRRLGFRPPLIAGNRR